MKFAVVGGIPVAPAIRSPVFQDIRNSIEVARIYRFNS